MVVLQQLRIFLIKQLKQRRLRDRSQKGYLETRLRPPASRIGHPQGVGHVSKALKAWLTGMKPLENSLFTLPLQGKFDVSPRANALQGKPLQSFWNWPCRSCPWKPQVSTPSRCSSRNKPPKSCQDLESRRVRKALWAFEGVWHPDLQSMPQNWETVAETTPLKWGHRPLVAPLAFDTPWVKRANHCPTQRRERHTR